MYAYYPGVDTVAHEHGIKSDFYRAELRAADWLVDSLLDALPDSAALLITSDHGQMEIEPDGWVELPALEPLVEFQAGDARFRYLYARPGAARELAEAAHAEAGARAWVLTREQLFDEGWLGPRPAGSIGGRVGDVVLAARDAVAFVDPALPQEAALQGDARLPHARRDAGPAGGGPRTRLTASRSAVRRWVAFAVAGIAIACAGSGGWE